MSWRRGPQRRTRRGCRFCLGLQRGSDGGESGRAGSPLPPLCGGRCHGVTEGGSLRTSTCEFSPRCSGAAPLCLRHLPPRSGGRGDPRGEGIRACSELAWGSDPVRRGRSSSSGTSGEPTRAREVGAGLPLSRCATAPPRGERFPTSPRRSGGVGRELFGASLNGARCGGYSAPTSSRPMRRRRISLVPAPISSSLASRT